MQDRSVGIIVFREDPRKYLVLMKHGGTDFPKGHVEKGETDQEGALRETMEEAGITAIELIPGFKENITYFFRSGKSLVKKTVTFFLGKTQQQVTISDEHEAYRWCTFSEAMKVLTFKDQKDLLKKAEKYLKSWE